jgi:Tfp pilus assembly protein PilE
MKTIDICPHCGKSREAKPGLTAIEWVMVAGVVGILTYIAWPIVVEFIRG